MNVGFKKAFDSAIKGENVLYVCKYRNYIDDAVNTFMRLTQCTRDLLNVNINIDRINNIIYIENGSVRFICFDEAFRKSKGYRGTVMYDEFLQNDFETFASLEAINRSANIKTEEAFKDKMFVVTDEDGKVKMTCVPYRECYVDHVKSGALYDVYRYTCCGYEHSESRTDAGASEIPMNWCPNCGAKVVEKESGNER